MGNIILIDSVVKQDKNVVKKRKNKILYATMFVLGVAIIAIAYSTEIKNSLNLAPACVFGGWLLMAISIIGFVLSKKVFYYKPTKEKFIYNEYFFKGKDKSVVIEAINSKRIYDILKSATKELAPIMVSVYETPSHSCTFVQINEYIPYEYVPITPTLAYNN